jgi:hypothetical protein
MDYEAERARQIEEIEQLWREVMEQLEPFRAN